MARAPLNTADVKIEQMPPVVVEQDRKTIVEADASILADKEQAELLAMAEDPVTIVIMPSGDQNAPAYYPVWVNGKGAEALIQGKWLPITYVPVGVNITLKRKYVEVLGRAKVNNVKTHHDEANVPMPRNEVRVTTTAVCSFQVVEDRNPRGVAWLTDLLRRQA